MISGFEMQDSSDFKISHLIKGPKCWVQQLVSLMPISITLVLFRPRNKCLHLADRALAYINDRRILFGAGQRKQSRAVCGSFFGFENRHGLSENVSKELAPEAASGASTGGAH